MIYNTRNAPFSFNFDLISNISREPIVKNMTVLSDTGAAVNRGSYFLFMLNYTVLNC